jgi:antitoxin CcdA
MRITNAHTLGHGMPSDQNTSRKRAVNISIDRDLLAEARELGANISEITEQALAERLRDKRWKAWRKENMAATKSMNDYVTKNGLWSKKYRTW